MLQGKRWTEIPLVNLHLSLDIFNYCDLSKYNAVEIQRLLDAHNLTRTDTWSVVYDFAAFFDNCLTKDSMNDMYTFYWDVAFASYIQSTGIFLLQMCQFIF
jgi:hypothetical protein